MTLLSILPPQPKKMSVRYKVMRGYECCIYANRIRSPLLSWRDWYLKKFKDEKNNRLFETYKNMWWRMGTIFMQQHLTQPWLKYVHIHHTNMHWHPVNVCCIVVPISCVLIFQAKIQIGIIQTYILKYVFIFATQLQVIKCLEESQ